MARYLRIKVLKHQLSFIQCFLVQPTFNTKYLDYDRFQVAEILKAAQRILDKFVVFFQMIIQIISFFFLFIVEVLDNFAQSPAFVAVANHTAIYGRHQVLDICSSISTILRENDLGYYFIVIVIPKRQRFSAFSIQSNFYRCIIHRFITFPHSDLLLCADYSDPMPSELQVKEIIPTLTIAPDITKVVIPQGCGYLILDKNFNELYSNMDDDEKEIALLYAKGEYIEYATGRQFALVVRENEFCVLRYYIGSQFTVSWLPEYFPSPDTLAFILMAVNSLLVIIILTARFAKNLRTQLTPLFEATAEVSKQNLDFEVGHAKIKEFEDVLASFSDMKDNLKISLERQWKTEQTQKEQIAALAHDLKTPLTVIQGNADLLTETNLDDEQRLYAGYVVESSGQMQSYIQTLIDISRAAVGYQLHIESIDLPAFMQHLFGYMESLCRTKEIRLQMNTVSLPQMLKFDRVLIERAIMNVISNGLDYAPQGGTLYVDVQSNNGFVEISVTDEGTGFSKEALCHAQERFYMGDQSRNSKLHFGMGLYITNSIMEQHNGQLILENSKETGGAKVTMKLPC